MSVAIQVYLDINIRFFSGALDFSSTLAAIGYLGGFVPTLGSRTAGDTVDAEEAAANVPGKLAVGIAVANDVAVLNVVFGIVDVFLDHARVGFSGRCVILGEVRVNQDVVERDTFAFERVENEVLDGPERVFRESVGAQAVLVADHHEFVVGMLSQENEVADSTGYEFQFFKSVDLFVGRFLNDGAVAVNEEYCFHIEFRDESLEMREGLFAFCFFCFNAAIYIVVVNQRYLTDVELDKAAKGKGGEGERRHIRRHAQRVAYQQSLVSLLVGIAQNGGRQHDHQSHYLHEQCADKEDEEQTAPVTQSPTIVVGQCLPIAAGCLHQVLHQNMHHGE